MKKKLYIFKLLLISLVIFGLGSSGMTVLAEKKATEGNNDADVEFYKPTPKKDDPKDDPKKDDPNVPKNIISKVLPQTGEHNSNSFMLLGISILGGIVFYQLRFKKVGVDDDN